jgi:hypothetical protein
LYFCVIVLALIGCLFPQALTLLESQHEKRTVESAQAAKNAELEVLVSSQAEKIAELEAVCADLKCEKECITAGYRRLSDKHKIFTKKAEREKTELVETHCNNLGVTAASTVSLQCCYSVFRVLQCLLQEKPTLKGFQIQIRTRLVFPI